MTDYRGHVSVWMCIGAGVMLAVMVLIVVLV
jgi:hypothetical protein